MKKSLLLAAALTALFASWNASAQNLGSLTLRYGAPELCASGSCPTVGFDPTPNFSPSVYTYWAAPPRTVDALWATTDIAATVTPVHQTTGGGTTHEIVRKNNAFTLPLTVTITTIGDNPKSYTVYFGFGPGAPTLNSITSDSVDQELEINWSPPSSDSGSPITGYRYRHALSDDPSVFTNSIGSSGEEIPGGADARSHSFVVFSFLTHHVQVAAVNAFDTGLWSNVVTGRTFRAPNRPRNLVADRGDQKLTVSWSEPGAFPNPADTPVVTNYRVRWAPSASAPVWVDPPGETGKLISGGAGARSYELTGLTNGTRYRVDVAAETSFVIGRWETTSGTPLGPPGPPSALTFTEVTATSVTLEWDPPTDTGGVSATLEYLVRWREDGGSAWLNPEGATGDRGTTPYTVTGLTAGTRYEVQVASHTFAGTSSFVSKSETARTVPGRPQSLGTAIADGKITVSWSAPANNGGADVSGYRVRWAQAATPDTYINPSGAAGESVTTGTSREISGLTNGVSYAIGVAAVNSEGTGDFAETSDNPATPPGVPTDLRAQAGIGRLSLEWNAPASNGGDAIEEYSVQHSQGAGTTNWTTVATGVSHSSYELGGLTGGAVYEVRVAARNDAGTGTYTAPVRATTGGFNMDVDRSGAVDWKDGVLIARYLAGVRGNALIAGLNLSGAAAIGDRVNAGVLADSFDVDGANGTTVADGVMIARYYLLGVASASGDALTAALNALTAGMSAAANAATVKTNIEALPQP
ncbi:MAG: fibronectin type III domain-containing protein [Gammaproteobacteria bacterium]|nr:fibronectin type III domain-containing protein [Gammaproteobacteria bacterium]